jgi:hypothetical protein
VTHYSRGQLAQIAKRIRTGNLETFRGGNTKCLICGGAFLGNSCGHTVEENQSILEKLKVSHPNG